MGFHINLETERGEVLAPVIDPQNHLHRLSERSLREQPLLAEIDWYGDTVFNRMQMPRFLSQWQALARNSQSADEELSSKKSEHLPNGAKAPYICI